MWNKIKEYILVSMARICFNQLNDRLQKEHDEHMQEIIEYIQARIDAGIDIILLAHPDMLEDRFALSSEPLPTPSHLTMVEEDER